MDEDYGLRSLYKGKLYDLLLLKKLNDGIEIKGLGELIIRTELMMSEEDVAYVEKIIAKLPE
ncbi:MAG: hypothetical protein FWC71_02045 [Defluviitaleaceae bacterium]|nr:hypothetical protein [Defluviitaleaceae bacterium]